MYKYLTFKETVTTPGIGTYIAYGIICIKIEKHEISCIKSVSDISTIKELVEKIAERCNSLEVSPLHLLDVIEEFLP